MAKRSQMPLEDRIAIATQMLSPERKYGQATELAHTPIGSVARMCTTLRARLTPPWKWLCCRVRGRPRPGTP